MYNDATVRAVFTLHCRTLQQAGRRWSAARVRGRFRRGSPTNVLLTCFRINNARTPSPANAGRIWLLFTRSSGHLSPKRRPFKACFLLSSGARPGASDRIGFATSKLRRGPTSAGLLEFMHLRPTRAGQLRTPRSLEQLRGGPPGCGPLGAATSHPFRRARRQALNEISQPRDQTERYMFSQYSSGISRASASAPSAPAKSGSSTVEIWNVP